MSEKVHERERKRERGEMYSGVGIQGPIQWGSLCFTAYTFCDVTSQLSSLKVGGALDPKNPDPYYLCVAKFLQFNI